VIYLDHHATTPCDPRVVEAMLPFFTDVFGNPAAVIHEHGRKASRAIEDARVAIARFFAVQPNEIYFTSGATESNNIALNLLAPGDHLITSEIEHKSVLAPAERLRSEGVELTILTPDREGFIPPSAVEGALRPNTRLVSIESANGEIGTLQDIPAIAAVCRSRNVLLHTDATQAVGKVPVHFAEADLASWSAHKLYGPKGIGGLYVRRGIRVNPLVIGGGQEKNVRSGTVNVPAVIGMAAALKLRSAEMEEEAARLVILRDDLRERLLASIDDVSVNGPRALRLPGNLNVSFGRVDSEALLLAMRRFSLSAGSACSTGERGPSRVLKAIGVSENDAMGSIRIGMGKSNTAEQMQMLEEDLTRAVRRIREITPA
jgi:cysteine desulfurase